MGKNIVDKAAKRAICDARSIIENIMKIDGNEADTRRRVERIFETVMHYNVFKHLSSERSIKGAGETEHADFVIQLEPGADAKPVIMIELKRVGVNLATKHLKQVASYAIDAGCEWILLTNGREWRIYHVEFGQPPKTQLIEQWDLLSNDVSDLASKFELLSFKNVKKGSLKKLWKKTTVLSPNSLLGAITSPESIKILCRIIRRHTDIMVNPEDLLSGFQKLLNENAAIELSKLKIVLPGSKKDTQVSNKKEPVASITAYQSNVPQTDNTAKIGTSLDLPNTEHQVQ